MRSLARLAVSIVCGLLAACASMPEPAPAGLWSDAAFRPASERIDAAEVFALSPAMKRYLAEQVATTSRQGREHALVDALQADGQLRLDYDAALTRTAAQVFEARRGNCLSLVIMTGALARELGLRVTYQQVQTPTSWTRTGGLEVGSGHVNLSLEPRLASRLGPGADSSLLIDFLPGALLHGQRSRPLEERTILAMFMNNRAAEALVAGRVDDAYWWARAAIGQDPAFVQAYNTLGVVYLRRGLVEQAENALRHALVREPDNTAAMGNLAQALQRQGRRAEAQALIERSARLEPEPPFHFYDLGMAALARKDFTAAKELFTRELARAGDLPEFHHGLGVANYRLGDLAAARHHLALALRHAGGEPQRELYAAKLEWLRRQSPQ